MRIIHTIHYTRLNEISMIRRSPRKTNYMLSNAPKNRMHFTVDWFADCMNKLENDLLKRISAHVLSFICNMRHSLNDCRMRTLIFNSLFALQYLIICSFLLEKISLWKILQTFSSNLCFINLYITQLLSNMQAIHTTVGDVCILQSYINGLL